MALFDFLKFSFFKGRDTADLAAEDLDFAKWIEAHRAWRLRLSNYIDGTSQETLDEQVVAQDNRCALGQWIHDHGQRFYGDEPTFQDVVNHHAAFHRCAGEVLHACRSDGQPAARKLLNQDFDRHSIQVITGLQILERRIKG